MSLLKLPVEILRLIVENLEGENNILSFLRTARPLFQIAYQYLYEYNVKYSGSSALPWCCVRGLENKVHYLLTLGANPNALDQNSKTSLSLAIEQKHRSVVEMLLVHQANVNLSTLRQSDPPLWCALKNNDIETAENLLEHGAEVDSIENYHGHTPLSIAVQEGKIALVELLLRYGADVNHVIQSPESCYLSGSDDVPSATPLHLAVDHSMQVLNKAREFGHDSGEFDYYLEESHIRLIQLLLNHGADWTLLDSDGATCLHDATCLPATNLLLGWGVNPNLADYDGRTAIDEAKNRGDLDCLEAMLRSEASRISTTKSHC